MFHRIIWHQTFVLVFILTLVFCVMADPAAAANPPDSGSVLDQIQRLPSPLPEKKPDEIAVPESSVTEPTCEQPKIHVKGFRLTGETIVPAHELLDLIKDQADQDLTLAELNGLAERITKYLRQKGYLVAIAYIPAQRIEDDIVAIAVVPGKFGQARIENKTSIPDGRWEKLLTQLKPDTVITQAALERVLLLMNDLAGVRVKATLKPGEAPGTADLILDVENTAKFSGGISSDNGGNPSTGRILNGINLAVNNLSHTGDQFRLGGLVTSGDLDHAYLNYNFITGYTGLRWDFNYSHVSYALGDEFAALDATGKAKVIGCSLSYPWIRSRAYNINSTAGFEFKRLEDEIGSVGMQTPRLDRLWKVGVYGDAVDARSTSNYSLSYIFGHLSMNGAGAIVDASTARTTGSFSKVVLDYGRTSYLSSNWSWNNRFSGQLASGNLDSSEKFYPGGISGVRAYEQGAVSGDQGYLFSTELRWRIPDKNPGKNDLYFTGFFDCGDALINKDPWSGMGNNHRKLNGPGLGVIWTNPGVVVRMDYAFRTGDQVTDDDKSRLWARLVANF